MQAWFDIRFVHERCAALREEAALARLARSARRSERVSARKRVARSLLALGELIVAAGHRVMYEGERSSPVL
jgi:hypothetical protein